MLLSNFLGRVRWTTDSPPGNTPCYLRRRDNDGLVLWRPRESQGSLSPWERRAVLQRPLRIQLGHPRTETKADAPVYVDSLAASREEAGPLGMLPRALAM